MNGKQAKMVSRMRMTRRGVKHWHRLPADIKGKLRGYYEYYEPMVYPSYRELLEALGYEPLPDEE